MISILEQIPEYLQRPENGRVLAFLQGKSAHGDVGEALVNAAAPLGDVQKFCPAPADFRYVLLATQGIVFSFAVGMRQIGFRLNQEYAQRALETGGLCMDGIGPDWRIFEVFRADHPAVDLGFWARKAYVSARGGSA